MEKTHYWTIGNNVRSFRMKSGMTQERLAEKAQLSPKVIQKVEAGKSGTNTETFIKIAYALGVSMDTLADIWEMDEVRKCQQEAFYMLVEDKTIEEIKCAVKLVGVIFQMTKEYLGCGRKPGR